MEHLYNEARHERLGLLDGAVLIVSSDIGKVDRYTLHTTVNPYAAYVKKHGVPQPRGTETEKAFTVHVTPYEDSINITLEPIEKVEEPL